jgi:hypothetical protein
MAASVRKSQTQAILMAIGLNLSPTFEFFIHPAMQASQEMGFPAFFRQDRDGQRRGVIQVVKAART